jgi:hypothetical protein
MLYLACVNYSGRCKMANTKTAKPNKRLVFQLIIDDERKSRLEKIAAHKGVSMSGQVRMWIDGAYNKLPEVKR